MPMFDIQENPLTSKARENEDSEEEKVPNQNETLENMGNFDLSELKNGLDDPSSY